MIIAPLHSPVSVLYFSSALQIASPKSPVPVEVEVELEVVMVELPEPDWVFEEVPEVEISEVWVVTVGAVVADPGVQFGLFTFTPS